MKIENMKAQRFGVEVEMNNIRRDKAAMLAAGFFGTCMYKDTAARNGYCTWSAWDQQGREWKFQRDVSIQGPDSQKCEMVTPILTYSDMDTLQELCRILRRAGAKSTPSRGCGVHIHVDAKGQTPQTLRNLVNIMASHENLLTDALKLDRNRMDTYCRTVDPRLVDTINRRKPQTMPELADELDEIFDIDMERFGFDLSEFEEQPEVVEDDFEPVVPDEPKAKPGDIYQLGRHYLMCGDSTSVEDVKKLMDGQTVSMLLTDPPYNVDYHGTAGTIQNDKMQDENFRTFLRDAFRTAKTVMKPGAVFHVWHAETQGYNFRGALKDVGFTCRQQLIWVKSSQTLGRQDFQRMYEGVLTGDNFDDEEMAERGYEACLYGWKDGAGHKWYKKRKEKDVLFFDKPRASAEHPTMKPILLFDYEMQCNTKKGDAVLDLFAGSGTTIMAAEQNDRIAYCMELDPRFVDVIINRWEEFTGEEAKKL